MQVETLFLRRVLNSRAEWTVQAEVNGHTASAPSGASAGSHEVAAHIPENMGAVAKQLCDALIGENLSQEDMDATLRRIDGTDNFSTLGSTAIATSLAFAKACGITTGTTFPYPVGNVVGGGAHGGATTIQEFLVIPAAADTFPEAVQINAQIYRELRDRYRQRFTGLNDESALVLNGLTDVDVLSALKKLCDKHGARIGVDVAANEFYNKDTGTYSYPGLGMELDAHGQRKFLLKLIEKYDLLYVEDAFHEDDFESFSQLQAAVNREELDCLVVGDDLTTTNPERVQHAIDLDAVSACIIKPNQIGTVTDTFKTVKLCRENNVAPVVSHRSGETEDTATADLALSWEAPFVKMGVAGLRIAKLNKLLHRWYHCEQTGDTPKMAELSTH